MITQDMLESTSHIALCRREPLKACARFILQAPTCEAVYWDPYTYTLGASKV